MIKKGLIMFFVLFCTFFALKVNAQIQKEDILLNINPQYPKVNESVNASVSTHTTNLNNAKISWMLNGETKLEGIGKKDFSFNVGGNGTATSLEVTIETINGSSINKKITISPSSVDMLWEAYDTYVPPFYKGKKLASKEGNIKIVAIPSEKSLTGFNYKWKQDGKNKLSASGYEKNFYIYKNTFLEEKNTIEVGVSDILGNGIGSNTTTITPGNPKIVFYKKDPILGVKWENILEDGFFINKDGETIVAEPYFFSKGDLNSSNYEFKWLINGEETVIPNQKNILSVKLEGDKSGSAIVKIIINNTKTLFQSVEKTINVNF